MNESEKYFTDPEKSFAALENHFSSGAKYCSEYASDFSDLENAFNAFANPFSRSFNPVEKQEHTFAAGSMGGYRTANDGGILALGGTSKGVKSGGQTAHQGKHETLGVFWNRYQ